MARKYHTLLTMQDDKWAIEFGDYDRETVEYERDEYKDRGDKTKIITTGDKQADIQAAVDKLNGDGNWRV